MLKKTIISTVSAIILSTGFISAANAADVTIGTVDSNMIVAKSSLYSALRKAQGELATLQQSYQKDFAAKAAKLQSAKTKDEYEKLAKQYNTELKVKQEQAMKAMQSKQQSLESMQKSLRAKVEVAIRDIAKQKKLTYVVDKQAMFYGGTDITNDVLARIK